MFVAVRSYVVCYLCVIFLLIKKLLLAGRQFKARSYRSDMRDMRDTYRDTFRPDARFCPEVDFRRAIYREITPVYGVTKTICIAR